MVFVSSKKKHLQSNISLTLISCYQLDVHQLCTVHYLHFLNPFNCNLLEIRVRRITTSVAHHLHCTQPQQSKKGNEPYHSKWQTLLGLWIPPWKWTGDHWTGQRGLERGTTRHGRGLGWEPLDKVGGLDREPGAWTGRGGLES